MHVLGHRRFFIALSVLVGLILMAGSVGPVSSVASADTDDDCHLPDGVLQREDLPAGSSVVACDAEGRVVEGNNGLQLEVPAPGQGSGIESMSAEGMNETFEITTSDSGQIAYDEHGSGEQTPGTDAVSEEPDGAAATNPTTACDRTTYLKTGEKLPGSPTYSWYLGDGARPGSMTTSDVRGAIDAATTNWFNLRNPCGMSGPSHMQISYLGQTTYESDMSIVSGQTVCNSNPDNHSTVDFGDLARNGDPDVALNCWWFDTSDHIIDETDIRFNVVDYSWTLTPGSDSCNNSKYDLQSVATHEIGHAWGLKDLYTTSDRYLTMYGHSFKCKKLARTLGRGDVKGWKDVYNQ